ncbi:BTAD domain-containing putative transcriptional regulator [Streptomyces sp. NPDC091268]|uniref:BTAD domain-containing putative transcriptional regulator n=1 Tax=Streptomyces sp. NPDC091268 TaxID=3365979 RepID=UPI00381D437E
MAGSLLLGRPHPDLGRRATVPALLTEPARRRPNGSAGKTTWTTPAGGEEPHGPRSPRCTTTSIAAGTRPTSARANPTRKHLHEGRPQAIEFHFEPSLHHGRHRAIPSQLARWAADHPLHEPFRPSPRGGRRRRTRHRPRSHDPTGVPLPARRRRPLGGRTGRAGFTPARPRPWTTMAYFSAAAALANHGSACSAWPPCARRSPCMWGSALRLHPEQPGPAPPRLGRRGGRRTGLPPMRRSLAERRPEPVRGHRPGRPRRRTARLDRCQEALACLAESLPVPRDLGCP